ncbi:hypothetical protein Tco_1380615, partial [Tanacetum coccineum]
QKFEDPPFEEEILSFIRDFGHTGEIKVLSDVNVNHLHQPWRSFAAIINKCLSGKTTALESLHLSRAQILWGMYHNKNVDYVYLLWEDLVYQVENKNSKKNNDMYYPRFTKVIVDYFMAKDQAIPRRNKKFWHYARDDFMFTTIRVISKHQDTRVYIAILPQHLTNQAMLGSKDYKTYLAYATGEKIPKPKYVKIKLILKHLPKRRLLPLLKARDSRLQQMRLNLPRRKAEQMKLATKRSLIETHSSHASGSGANEGTSSKPGVPNVPTYGSDDEEISWKSSNEEDDDEVGLNDDDDDNDYDEDNDDDDDDADNHNDDDQEDDGQDDEDQDDVNEQTDSDNDGDDFFHPKLSTQDQKVRHSDEESDEEIQGANVKEEELDEEETNDEDEANELYRDVNVNSRVLLYVLVTTIAEPPLLSTTTLPPPPTPLITHLQQTLIPTPTTVLSSSLQDLPNFGSLFRFDHRLKTLENDFLEFKQTNQFAAAVSSIPGIVDMYLANKMNEDVKTSIQLESDRPRDESQAKNKYFLNKLDDNIKKIIKDQVKEQVKAQVSKILPKIEKTVNKQLEDEVLTCSSNESKASHVIAANLSELELKKILIDKIKSNKAIHRSDEQKNLYKALVDAYKSEKLILDTYGDIGSKRRRAGKEPESTSASKEKTSKTTGKSTEGSKSHHKSAGESAQAEEPRHTTKDLEEPAHLEFKTGVTKDQPDKETSQLPDWFHKPAKPPTPDRDWNKTFPNAH